MKIQRLAIALTAINLILLVVTLARTGPTTTAQPATQTLRGRVLELVDGRGQVRSRLNVEASGEVVLRLFDPSGTIRVKLGAGTDGSGLVLNDEATEPGVQYYRQAERHRPEADHDQRHPDGCERPAASDHTVAAAMAEPVNQCVGVTDMTAIRYFVSDVDRAMAFYIEHLGFTLERHMPPAFASVSKGDLTLWLSGPQSSGARSMPDGRRPEPGGWNRFVLEVDDLSSFVATLKQAGMRFRNEIVTGPGGKQILMEDPDENPVELFEPAS